MAYSRFEHEQQLLQCWNVTNDLKTVLDSTENLDLPADQLDTLQSMLCGMIALYDAKFDTLFKTFEQSIKDGSCNK